MTRPAVLSGGKDIVKFPIPADLLSRYHLFPGH